MNTWGYKNENEKKVQKTTCWISVHSWEKIFVWTPLNQNGGTCQNKAEVRGNQSITTRNKWKHNHHPKKGK